MFVACEAGTRHGHYNWRWFGADDRTSVPTVRGGLLHALHIIRLFAACEAGTRRGHYSGYSLLDRRLRTLEPSPVVVDIRCLSSIGININGVDFNITIIFSIFAYNKV